LAASLPVLRIQQPAGVVSRYLETKRFTQALRQQASLFSAELFVYWPLARSAEFLPAPESWPLEFYANRSFYVMRTDAPERFGAKLEKRFTKQQIISTLRATLLEDIQFTDSEPFWTCTARKSS
jgi:hypothetical protein